MEQRDVVLLAALREKDDGGSEQELLDSLVRLGLRWRSELPDSAKQCLSLVRALGQGTHAQAASGGACALSPKGVDRLEWLVYSGHPALLAAFDLYLEQIQLDTDGHGHVGSRSGDQAWPELWDTLARLARGAQADLPTLDTHLASVVDAMHDARVTTASEHAALRRALHSPSESLFLDAAFMQFRETGDVSDLQHSLSCAASQWLRRSPHSSLLLHLSSLQQQGRLLFSERSVLEEMIAAGDTPALVAQWAECEANGTDHGLGPALRAALASATAETEAALLPPTAQLLLQLHSLAQLNLSDCEFLTHLAVGAVAAAELSTTGNGDGFTPMIRMEQVDPQEAVAVERSLSTVLFAAVAEFINDNDTSSAREAELVDTLTRVGVQWRALYGTGADGQPTEVGGCLEALHLFHSRGLLSTGEKEWLELLLTRLNQDLLQAYEQLGADNSPEGAFRFHATLERLLAVCMEGENRRLSR